jgi:hypothetical protein
MIFVPAPVKMSPTTETVGKPAILLVASWTQPLPQTAVKVEIDSFVNISLPTAQQKISRRIKDLSSRSDGWLDGEGQAMPPGSDTWLIDNFSQLDFITPPAIFPTPEGNLIAEWSLGPWEASAEVNLKTRTVLLHALDTETLVEREETLSLDTAQAWKRIPEFINALVAP